MAQYAYINGTGTTTIESTGGFTLRRIIVGTVPGGDSAALVSVWDSSSASGQEVALLALGGGEFNLNAGSYEFGANLANGLTIEIANEDASLTVIYE